jgi:hypothetical protein
MILVRRRHDRTSLALPSVRWDHLKKRVELNMQVQVVQQVIESKRNA